MNLKNIPDSDKSYSWVSACGNLRTMAQKWKLTNDFKRNYTLFSNMTKLYLQHCVFKEQNKLSDYTTKPVKYVCKWNLIPHFKWMEKQMFSLKNQGKGQHKSFSVLQ